MIRKSNGRFDSKNKENEVDLIEQMKQKNNDKADLKRTENEID